MKIVKNLAGDTPDGISYQLRLERFQTPSPDEVLMYGINCTFDRQLQEEYQNYKRKVLLNLWSPCEFTVKDNAAGNAFHQVDYFDEVYAVCPFTVDWLNKKFDNRKHKFMYHPFDYTYIPNSTNKMYDVCYFGGMNGEVHRNCVQQIQKFNYRLISQRGCAGITNCNVPNRQKLDIVAQTKISVCYHYIPLQIRHINQIKTYDGWQLNEAFKCLDALGTAPQLKARMHEAALCKTLNLVQRDPWNVVECFYTPDEDFLYFNNNKDLPDLIALILENWNDYQPIVESAYRKCLTYGAKDTVVLITDKGEIDGMSFV